MADSILNFMNGEVSKYIIPDIQKLIALRPQGAEGTAGCTIPTAMLLFATIDLFGYLIRDDCREPKNDNTKGNLRALFYHPLGNFPSDYIDRLDTLVYLFRHGLMHQVFPKMAGIQKNGFNSPLFVFFNNQDHLNVDRFSRDVIDMLSNFKSNLSQPKWTDLCDKMSKRLSEAPRPQGGASKKPVEGDCIPLAPAPHSSPSTGRGILRGGIHKLEGGIKNGICNRNFSCRCSCFWDCLFSAAHMRVLSCKILSNPSHVRHWPCEGFLNGAGVCR
jgi:hypothetical protein